MWLYEQKTGKLFNREGKLIATGYAGRDEGDEKGKNNPEMQKVKGIGPLPCGDYSILGPRNHPTVGKYALPLQPDATNEMFGRTSFFMHGDSKEHPGLASHGCICQLFENRKKVWNSADHRLRVIAELPDGENTVECAKAALGAK